MAAFWRGRSDSRRGMQFDGVGGEVGRKTEPGPETGDQGERLLGGLAR